MPNSYIKFSKVTHEFALSTKFTSPSLAPPTHTASNGLSPHTALAALIHPSHLPLDTLIVAPATVVVRSNLAVPLAPLVLAGEPWHFVIAPAIPPQIASVATMISWESRVLASG
jgi:hypothetical protein